LPSGSELLYRQINLLSHYCSTFLDCTKYEFLLIRPQEIMLDKNLAALDYYRVFYLAPTSAALLALRRATSHNFKL
jgi:uncharacterized membrane protein